MLCCLADKHLVNILSDRSYFLAITTERPHPISLAVKFLYNEITQITCSTCYKYSLFWHKGLFSVHKNYTVL